jgi:hypothetical protein
MTDYPFEMQLVVDPLNSSNVVANGQVFIYNTADTTNSAPLGLTDPNGTPLSNPLMSNSLGFISAFITSAPQVKWVGGGCFGYFNSFTGLRDEAAAAALAAQGAIDTAAAASASAADAAAAAQQAAADAAAAATAGGSTSNIAIDTDGVPYFLA